MPTDRKIPTTVHLPESVRLRAQAAAELDKRSLSTWVELAILAALKRSK